MPDSDREGQALSPASAGAQAAPPCGTPARQLNANAPPMNPIRNSDGLSPSEFSLSGISLSEAVQRRDRNRHHALIESTQLCHSILGGEKRAQMRVPRDKQVYCRMSLADSQRDRNSTRLNSSHLG